VLAQAQILLRSDSYLFLSNRRNLLEPLGATLNKTNKATASD
jgi:hypothetical protein